MTLQALDQMLVLGETCPMAVEAFNVNTAMAMETTAMEMEMAIAMTIVRRTVITAIVLQPHLIPKYFHTYQRECKIRSYHMTNTSLSTHLSTKIPLKTLLTIILSMAFTT